MIQNDFEEYKKAVKSKYEKEKNGIFSNFLLLPSRANLRNLCAERLKGNKSSDDLASYKILCGFDYEEGNIHRLKKFTGRFRSIENFFKGTTDTNDIEAIDLAAILVDFNPRPFRKFTKENNDNYKKDDQEVKAEEKKTPQSDPEKEETKNPERGPLVLLVNDKAKANNRLSSFFIKQKKTAFILAAGLSFVGYFAKGVVYPDKDFMVWKEDHYELFDKKNEKIQTLYWNPVPYNEIEFNRKKLKVCDTTTFFKNSKPIVWYSKHNNVVEFFNMDGIHPENAEVELKKITNYMIGKHVAAGK